MDALASSLLGRKYFFESKVPHDVFVPMRDVKRPIVHAKLDIGDALMQFIRVCDEAPSVQ